MTTRRWADAAVCAEHHEEANERIVPVEEIITLVRALHDLNECRERVSVRESDQECVQFGRIKLKNEWRLLLSCISIWPSIPFLPRKRRRARVISCTLLPRLKHKLISKIGLEQNKRTRKLFAHKKC